MNTLHINPRLSRSQPEIPLVRTGAGVLCSRFLLDYLACLFTPLSLLPFFSKVGCSVRNGVADVINIDFFFNVRNFIAKDKSENNIRVLGRIVLLFIYFPFWQATLRRLPPLFSHTGYYRLVVGLLPGCQGQ